MATPLYVGDTSFRTVDIQEQHDRRGLDSVTIVRRGDLDSLAAESALWTKGKNAASLGYAFCVVNGKSVRENGPFGEVTLRLEGFIDATTVNPISVEDSISESGTTLVNDEVDANDNLTNVQVKFMAQTTTTRWISYSTNMPLSPGYPATTPSTINVGSVYDPYPAKFSGTLQSKIVGRLVQFDRVRLSEGVWAVLETWQIRLEPKDPILISSAA